MNVTNESTHRPSMMKKKRRGEHVPSSSCQVHIRLAACWNSHLKSSTPNLGYFSPPSAHVDLSTDTWLCKDFSFLLECNAFKWRWETIFVGHKVSADILSKHLIMPLISVNHLAFSSPDVVGDLPPTDLEKVTVPAMCIHSKTVLIGPSVY